MKDFPDDTWFKKCLSKVKDKSPVQMLICCVFTEKTAAVASVFILAGLAKHC